MKNLKIEENTSLKNYNTFKVDVKAKYLAIPKTIEEIKGVLEKFKDEKLIILGGGSNVLFTKDWDGLVLIPNLKGINVVKEDDKHVYVQASAGEIWDEFVRWCVKNDYAGIENMVMIPGTVGGGVSQNIGAYGQEISKVIEEIKVLDIETFEEKRLKPKDCAYGYRKSNFKNIWQNRYLITSTIFKLTKHTKEFELSYHERAGRYGSLKEELDSFAKEPYSIQDVMEAIVRQRGKRLPSVEEYGTAGSFFANPIVTVEKFNDLSKIIEELQSYPAEGYSDEYLKIPAGRLLDELGWKGKKIGNVATFERHALCVVTNMNATGEEILNFIKEMQRDVKEQYDIELIPEVNIIY
ncbi:MAG TPA: UDP-N-acetylmuramate dehydrogenase [Candidatus Dojkabacteria bacterium]|nr:UDP-N-acetylmuramate dehydrogenase [Candidatus Dojkabacteria bacterium]